MTLARSKQPHQHNRSDISTKASLILTAYEGVQRAYTQGKEYWKEHYAYSVTVSEKDVLYGEVHDWLIEIMPNEKHRSLSVGSGHNSREIEASDSTIRTEIVKPLIIRFNESSPRKIVIDKWPVTVSLVVPDAPEGLHREREPSKIQFVTSTYAGQQAVIRQLEKLNSDRRTSRKAVLKMVGQWGSWATRSDLPPRSMESIAMPEVQKNRIVKDLKIFLDSEEQYNRLAIPWHRGYMFHGPPGTGKTSLVKGLASEFNLDLWYISLSDLNAESSLLSLLAEVGPRSLLLLEDIDTAKITHDRDGADQGKISMSSLLNSLDGVATPHGLITVMTTNRFDILDPALTRAGRMDLVEELDYPLRSTIGNMYKYFYGQNLVWPAGHRRKDVVFEGTSTAQISEVFKRHMSDARSARKALMHLLEIEDK